MTEKRHTSSRREKLMKVFGLADVEYVDRTLLQVSFNDANLKISPEEIDVIFSKIPNNSNDEVAVKDVVRYLNMTGKRKEERAKEIARKKGSVHKVSDSPSSVMSYNTRNKGAGKEKKKFEVTAESESESSSESREDDSKKDGANNTEDQLLPSPLPQFSNVLSSNGPSESHMMDGFSDWQGNTVRSTLHSTNIFRTARSDEYSNQGFEFDCSVALQQVIMSLKNRNVINTNIAIQTLKVVQARVQQYENTIQEFRNLKEDNRRLQDKCTNLEKQAEDYKATIQKLEEHRERLNQKRIDDVQEITSNYNAEIQKHVKNKEKWIRKHGKAQTEISRLMLLSNQMTVKLEKKKKKKKLRGQGVPSRRAFSSQLSLTDTGIEEKYRASYGDSHSVQLESMPNLRMPDRWSDKQRALSVEVNQYVNTPPHEKSAPEMADVRSERGDRRRGKKKKKMFRRAVTSIKPKKSRMGGRESSSRSLRKIKREYSGSKKRKKHNLHIPEEYDVQSFSEPDRPRHRGHKLNNHRDSRRIEDQRGYIPGDEEDEVNPLTQLLTSPTQEFDDGESTVFSRTNKKMDVSLGAKDRW